MDEESVFSFSRNIGNLKMYLMAGDCGNVTHLKTHGVARPLLVTMV